MGLCQLGMQRHQSKNTRVSQRPCSSLRSNQLPSHYRHEKYYCACDQCTLAIEKPPQTRDTPYGNPFRDNTYRICFQEHGPEHLVANGKYFNRLPKGVHLDQIQKEIPKSTACLPMYIDDVHAVGHQFLRIVENSVFNPLIPARKLGSFITRH